MEDFEKLVKQFEAKMKPITPKMVETGIIPEEVPPVPPQVVAPPAEGKPACISKDTKELITLFFDSLPICPE